MSLATPIQLRIPAHPNSPTPRFICSRFLAPRPKAKSRTPTTDEIRDMGYYDRSKSRQLCHGLKEKSYVREITITKTIHSA